MSEIMDDVDEALKLIKLSSYDNEVVPDAVRSMIRVLRKGNLKETAGNYAPNLIFPTFESHNYFSMLNNIVRLAMEIVKLFQFQASVSIKVCEGALPFPSNISKLVENDVLDDNRKFTVLEGYIAARRKRIERYGSKNLYDAAELAKNSLKYAENQLELSEKYLKEKPYVEEQRKLFENEFEMNLNKELSKLDESSIQKWIGKVKDIENPLDSEVESAMDFSKMPPKVAIAFLKSYRETVKFMKS